MSGDTSEPQVDGELFWGRLKKLREHWIQRRRQETEEEAGGRDQTKNLNPWKDVEGVVVLHGTSRDDVSVIHSPSSQLHNLTEAFLTYLFDFEFTNTLMVLTENTLLVGSTAKKIGILQKMKDSSESQSPSNSSSIKPKELRDFQLKLVTWSKSNTDDVIQAATDLLLSSSSSSSISEHNSDKGNREKIASFINDSQAKGPYAEAWKKACQSSGIPISSLGGGGGNGSGGKNDSDATSGDITTSNSDSKVDIVDLAPGFLEATRVKDEKEIKLIEAAAKMTARVMQRLFVKRMESIVDEGNESSHSSLADELLKAMNEPDKVKTLKRLINESSESGESYDASTTPVICSGGEYDFSLNASSNDKNLQPDTIISTIAMRYFPYHAQVSRTYIIGPTPTQEEIYKLVTEALDVCISELQPGPGKRVCDAYNAAVNLVKQRRPEMEQYLTSDAGWSIGLSLYDDRFLIDANNTQEIVKGMVFAVRFGLKDVPFPEEERKSCPRSLQEAGKFSILVGETIAVLPAGSSEKDEEGNLLVHKNLTSSALRKWDAVNYAFEESDDDDDDDNDDEDQEQEQEEGKKDGNGEEAKDTNKAGKQDKEGGKVNGKAASKNASSSSSVDDTGPPRARRAKEAAQQAETQKINDQNFNLEQVKKMERKAARAGDLDDDGTGEEDEGELIQSFKDAQRFPSDMQPRQLYCDKSSECVFIPVGDTHVPFHVSTIRSVSKNDEAQSSFLRFNFYTPSGTLPKDVSRQTRTAIDLYPDMIYVKELSVRSRDASSLNSKLRIIKDMQKLFRNKQRKLEEEKNLVEQKDLVPYLNRPPNLRATLDDVQLRPALGRGNKCVGRLQAHQNGFRFRSSKGETLDVIYSNVKHFLFQPSKGELMVIIHLELKNPIMVGKHKSHGVQFFKEVMDSTTQLLDGSKRDSELDGASEERRERALRKKFDSMFRDFCKQSLQIVENHNERIGVDNDVDSVTHREHSFYGVPNKEMVLLQPTAHCLVNLTDWPYFLVTLSEVDHVHFERVSGGITRNFDMVVILKEHLNSNATSLPQRISSIPIGALEKLKLWLNEYDHITVTSGSLSLNWKSVMEAVRDQLARGVFWADEDEDGEKKDAGWMVLNLEDSAQEEEDDEDDESFAEEDEEEEDDDDDDDDDFSDDVVDEDEEDDDEEMEGLANDDEEEEGYDTDELEREAAQEDKEAERREKSRSRSDGDRPKKRQKQ